MAKKLSLNFFTRNGVGICSDSYHSAQNLLGSAWIPSILLGYARNMWGRVKYWLLLTIHPKLLQTSKTTEWTLKKGTEIWMDWQMPTSLQYNETEIHRRTSTRNARSQQTLSNWMWCLKVHTGAVLTQLDTNGDRHHCAFISKTFSLTEKKYEIYDRELLAIFRALEEWRHYIQGSPHMAIVLSDHKNLTYYQDARKLNQRQAQWSLFLSKFDIKLVHISGL